MNAEIQKVCDLIIENRTILRKKMFWELDSNTYAIMGALICASRGVKADADRYRECKKILRKNVNVFSEIRGTVEAAVVTRMMLTENSEEYIRGVLSVYRKLRSIHKFTATPHMVMAAMNIYEFSGEVQADEGIDRLETLYKRLKKQHPMLIWDSDRGYLSMITSSGMNVESIVEKTEASYEACKKIYFDKDAVHSMAQVMALSDRTPQEQSEFVKALIRGLKDRHSSISRSFGMTALGALSMLNIPAEQLASDIADASDYLHQHKGFKWYNQDRRLRTVYAALAVFMAYAGQDRGIQVSNISTNIAMLIVEEIILLIILLSEESAAAASNSSSSG